MVETLFVRFNRADEAEEASVRADVEEPSWPLGPSCRKVKESRGRWTLATLEGRTADGISARADGTGRYCEFGEEGVGRYESEMPMAASAKSSSSSSR